MRELRDRLGQALQAHSYYKAVRTWKEPTKEELRLNPDRFTSESTKEEWRKMADRFINEIAPECELIELVNTPKEGDVHKSEQ